jgi:hypothetical protein
VTTYIAGPMTGYENFNYPAFNYAATALRAQGVDVVNPAELHGPDDSGGNHPWQWYLRAGIKAMLACDELVLLPGWGNSRGAQIERFLAEQLGMTVTEWAGTG